MFLFHILVHVVQIVMIEVPGIPLVSLRPKLKNTVGESQ